MRIWKSITSAAGWLLLFFASSIVVSLVMIIVAFSCDGGFFRDGLDAMLQLSSGMSITGDAARPTPQMATLAADYTLVLMGISYVPVLVVAAFAQRKRGNVVRKADAGTLFACAAAVAALNLVVTVVLAVMTSDAAPVFDTSDYDELAQYVLGGSPWLMVLVTGILAPIAEEIVFRRGVQRSLQGINPVFAIFASAALFGVVHGNLTQGIFASVIGLAFGYVFYKTDNIAYTIAMHVTVNMTGVIVTVTGFPEMFAHSIVIGTMLLAAVIASKGKPSVFREKGVAATWRSDNEKTLAEYEETKRRRAALRAGNPYYAARPPLVEVSIVPLPDGVEPPEIF